MSMQPVKSSNVSAIGYDAQEKMLTVQFTNGTTYRYEDVSPDVHKALVNADSIGKHFAKNIRGRFKHTKL